MPSQLVTVVTPSYNQGRFIRATIESVLSQDYPALEYIVMDGGSTDETAAVVRDYASRLTWISEKDRGQSHAINKGFQRAKGAIVAWLNSDDLILPGAVSKAVGALESEPAAGAVYGEGYFIDREGNTTGRFPHTEPFNLWRLVYLSDYILQQSVYFRRSIFDEVGFLREDLHYTMDWDILIRIGKRRPLLYIPEYMGCLREYPEAKSFAGGIVRVREIRRLLREHTGMLFPPGYIVYGFDTCHHIWSQKIEEGTPDFLRLPGRVLRTALTFVIARWIGHTINESQGWYPDKWATTEVKAMLPPPREQDLVIRGALPDCPITPQKLSVSMNGAVVAKETLGHGDFEIRVRVPIEYRYQPVHLRLKAPRAFKPCERADRRHLCYLLREIGLAGATKDAIPEIAAAAGGAAKASAR